MSCGSRGKNVDGLVNVRDLGGLRRADGTLTPSGVFFRSENVDSVTVPGWEQLRALGVRTVVDLRQPKECAEDRSPRPAWLTTLNFDLDGLEHEEFWADYRANGLVATALYYRPHIDALPQRAGSALATIVSAPPGGVLFHCMSGRDRTGMISMLLLAAVGTDPEEIVDDYLETVRLGEVRAAHAGTHNAEPALEALCQARGTTTEGAFRDALDAVDLELLFARSEISAKTRLAIGSWRGSIPLT